MSKSVYISLCSTQYKTLLNDLSSILLNDKPKLLSNRVLSNSNLTSSTFIILVKAWWNDETKYISLNHSGVKGVSVRLYKKNFKLTSKKLMVINKEDHGSIYFRYRDKYSQKLTSKKLGNYSPDSFKTYLKIAKELISHNCLGTSIIQELDKTNISECNVTLHTFLMGEFYQTKLNENPKTVDKKIKVVTRNFGNLLNLNLNEVTAEIVKGWLKNKERKLNRRQIEAGESRWVVKPSTLKEAVCTLRSCIELAKERNLIHSHDLYTLPRFKIDNEIIRYLSTTEEHRLYKAINDRNEQKLQNRIRTIAHRKQRQLSPPPRLTRCAFADHVSPFIILFKECGIRPGTIMNSRWSDIDFEARFFRIRKSIDKKSLANFVPLNELAYLTLKEWRKHHIHNQCSKLVDKKSDAWLFPSPQDPKYQLTTIKSAWQRLIKEAKIENFRFYDLRHDFASKIMMKTGNIYLVSHLLNHRQIETTKRYAHLMDQTKMHAVQTLDQTRSQHSLPTFLKKF